MNAGLTTSAPGVVFIVELKKAGLTTSAPGVEFQRYIISCAIIHNLHPKYIYPLSKFINVPSLLGALVVRPALTKHISVSSNCQNY
jgi:hypothetical protein